MITVQVQYDGYNRQLKILNGEVNALLEDGDVYTLAFLDLESGTEVEWIDFLDKAPQC